MSSTVACIGFTDPSTLATLVRESGEPFHELSSTYRWRDSSGAMLLLDRGAQYARPGYDTDVRLRYASLAAGASGLAQIGLVDANDFELDRFTVVPDARYTVGWNPTGRVALVAMGIDVEFFETAEDFFDSPRSAMPGFEGEPPPEVKQFGLVWPPPMEIETFMPSAKPNDPTATLSGTVQRADVRRNSDTGHEFLVTRLHTVCGEIDLCTPLPMDGAPQPGSVAVGQVQLLAGFGPFGEPDTHPYTPPQDTVSPTFRDGEPMGAAEIDHNAPIEDLPEGLVLGEDGIVRTAEEHAAWKGGDVDAGSRPKTAPAATSEEAHPEDEHDDRPQFHGVIAPDEPVTPEGTAASTGTELPSSGLDEAAQPSATGAEAAVDDDSAPRPGETRREWRARTGR